MKSFTLLVLLGVLFMVMGCNGNGSGGMVKTGCLSLVTLVR